MNLSLQEVERMTHELARLQHKTAGCTVYLIQLEVALRPVVARLGMDEQHGVNAPLIGLRNLLLGNAPRMSAAGKLLRLLRDDEPPEAA